MAEIDLRCPEGTGSEMGANRDGAYRIAWSGPEGAVMRLDEIGPGGSKTIYQGAAAIMFLFNNLLFGLGEIFHSNVW